MAQAAKKMNYTAMSDGVLSESIKELKIQTDAKTVPAKVLAISKYFKTEKIAGRIVLAECSTCNALSDENYRRCPFCGDAEIDVAEEEAGGDEEAEGEGAVDDSEADEVHVAEVVEVLTPEKGSTKSKRTKLPPEQQPTKALAKVVEHGSAAVDPKLKEKDLDKAVKNVQRHYLTAARSLWDMGNEIRDIFDRQLWRLRKGDDGEPQYKEWNKFVTNELTKAAGGQMTVQYAYMLMAVSKNFTEEEVQTHGVSKLHVLVSLKPEDKAKILNEMNYQSTTRTQVREHARELQSGTPAESRARTQAVMVRAPDSVELVMIGANKKGKPAQTLSDDPWVEEHHDNDVVTRYAVKVDPETGHIMLIITRRKN
jgi:hypothetical protein